MPCSTKLLSFLAAECQTFDLNSRSEAIPRRQETFELVCLQLPPFEGYRNICEGLAQLWLFNFDYLSLLFSLLCFSHPSCSLASFVALTPREVGQIHSIPLQGTDQPVKGGHQWAEGNMGRDAGMIAFHQGNKLHLMAWSNIPNPACRKLRARFSGFFSSYFFETDLREEGSAVWSQKFPIPQFCQ